MSSILTNNSAMVALQALKSINSNLTETQSMISSGKDISSARDNASVWAISKVMESDVKGFQGISDSLSLGQSTVSVARNASETVTNLLTDIKGKIVAAQEENVDRDKIQSDITALRDQIGSVVGAAQFNGLNLLKGTDAMSILSSLDRGANGSVTASSISVDRQDLSNTGAVFGTGGALTDPTIAVSTVSASPITSEFTVAGTFDSTGEGILKINNTEITFSEGADADATTVNIINAINDAGIEGITAGAGTGSDKVEISSTVGFGSTTYEVLAGTSLVTPVAEVTIAERAETATFAAGAVNEGDSYKLSLGADSYTYVAGAGDSFEEIANGLKASIDAAGNADVSVVARQTDAGLWEVAIDNSGANFELTTAGNAAGGTAAGGLAALDDIDVTTNALAEAALTAIEGLIDTTIDAAAEFGSSQGRIDTQSDFISNLTDSLKSGIGSMVDADMEETSARLQALQVQQQLGVQALSIANQSPQSILSLFR